MYKNFFNRKLTYNRVALNTYPIHIVRKQDRAYPKASHASRARLERILVLADYLGSSHYEFPPKAFTNPTLNP